ncbi:MAG: hypothetical protein WCC87_00110 [Candidatus Korobacteraceae bacterium]
MIDGLEPARLDETLTNNIRTLEQNLKCLVVALQPKAQYDLSSDQAAKLQNNLAPLSEPQSKQLQQTESETNLLLMAYKAA